MAISKNEIKFIKSLSQKKFREHYSLFVVEGEKLVQEALDSQFRVRNLYKVEDIGEENMAKISNLATPSPALAVVEMPQQISEADLSKIIESCPLALALDAVRDLGNLGTIVRIADWFGIDVIFASHDCVDIYNPKSIQATMGALFRKQISYCDLSSVCDKFTSAGLPVYGTFLDGQTIYNQSLSQSGLIVMGNEANGVSKEIESKVTSKLYIPSFAPDGVTSESLNVAIATAITCYEFRRNKY